MRLLGGYIMRSQQEINDLLQANYKELEQATGIKIRNGQAAEGIRKALIWVLNVPKCEKDI